jgi:hypothetical protein
MQKSYTLKEKNPVKQSDSNRTQPQKATLNSIMSFSKAYEVMKGKKQNIELMLN